MDKNQDSRPVLDRGIPPDRILPQQGKNGFIHQTGIHAKEGIHDIGHDLNGDQGRQQNCCLIYLQPAFAVNLVHKQGQQYSHHGIEHQKYQIVQDSIPDNQREIRCHGQKFKILQTHKFSAENAVHQVNLGEGHIQSEHGEVVINDQVDQPGQHKYIEWKVGFDPFPKLFVLLLHDTLQTASQTGDTMSNFRFLQERHLTDSVLP